MPAIPGTVIAAKVTTGHTDATFPVADQSEIRGGHHSAIDQAERDLIPLERRVEGMTCWVVADQATYRLMGGVDNIHWTLVVAGSGSVTGDYVARSGDVMTGRLEAPAYRVQDELVVHLNPELVVDFDGKAFQTGTLTLDGTLVTVNWGAGKQVAVRLISDGTDHTLDLAPGIRTLSTPAPFFVPAGRIAIASFASFGPAESDTVMVFAPEV
jgi:hypothetical protein